MDTQEHKLFIGMLATQLALTSELIAVLRENGSIQKADEQKIWKDAISTGPEKRHFLEQVSQLYQGMASALGLKLDLGEFPPKASR
jgi:hypothetical protein